MTEVEVDPMNIRRDTNPDQSPPDPSPLLAWLVATDALLVVHVGPCLSI
jgi:hypothetical protein